MLDLDAVHAAVGGTPGPGRLVALAALHAARKRAEHLHDDVTVWVVHPAPTGEQLRGYLAAGYELVDTGPPHPETGRGGPEGTGTAANVNSAATNGHDDRTSMPVDMARWR
ncbi:hypothetical protein SAMN04324258_3556 [Krasilnikoviella flava]|uniref:Uncharacterized protein n=1 Tax=Krasilnikoviella flava TaxID=526729 RepID=A0A1T5LJR0_9MICO|nr:hypothetical protein SAMN04324258_3556 [Krasilnikoviella flava]